MNAAGHDTATSARGPTKRNRATEKPTGRSRKTENGAGQLRRNKRLARLRAIDSITLSAGVAVRWR
jgi:hypothetical protein